MPDRAAKLVSAIFVSALAGAALAAVTHNAARAADDCLAVPKDETPEGSHWYYRIERGTKRHCWYLRAEGEKLSQTAQPTPSATAMPAASIAPPPMQRSVADAHAELPAQTSVQPPIRKDSPFPPVPTDPALSQGTAAGSQDAAAAPDAPLSVVASRWPDSLAGSSAISPQPAAEQLAANVQAGPQSDSSQSAASQSAASQSVASQSDSAQADSPQSDSAAAPPSATAAVPLATADSSQGLPASLPLLLAVMTGALALAGITASLVLKFGGARRTVRVRRNRIWEATDNDNIRPSARPDADVVPRRPLPRDLDQAAENDRVADFYAQISKRARS